MRSIGCTHKLLYSLYSMVGKTVIHIQVFQQPDPVIRRLSCRCAICIDADQIIFWVV